MTPREIGLEALAEIARVREEEQVHGDTVMAAYRIVKIAEAALRKITDDRPA